MNKSLKLVFFVLGLGVLLVACSSDSSISPSDSSISPLPSVISWNEFQGYVDTAGKPIALRGVAFGNEVWSSKDPSSYHHTEDDFERLRSMGLNAIRFYLSYHFFERDANPYEYRQSGFDWLDQNLDWAKQHGVYLFLNIHVPQGGFQSNGEGGALWTDISNQDRVVALWYNIAKHCNGNVNVAGYDLINEPVVTQSKVQWETLAQRIIDTIRTVDTTHLIFVERINGIINGSYSNDEEMNFVNVTDPYNRTGLTFHTYSPIEFTHQYASWTSFADQDGGAYPDTSINQFENVSWVTATFANKSVPAENSDWNYYTGKWYKVTDTSNANLARPALVCKFVEDGTVYFDSIKVESLSPSGDTAIVGTYDLPIAGNWYFWTEEEGGSLVLSDPKSVGITGTVSDANYADAKMRFILQEGYKYRASGKMKGENIPASAECLIRLDLEYAPSISCRNKASLSNENGKFVAVAKSRNVPIYMGEFGAISYTMTEKKGGLRWVEDMMDIFDSLGISFTYHVWHEDNFGIYRGSGSIDPTNANIDLIDLFKKRYEK